MYESLSYDAPMNEKGNLFASIKIKEFVQFLKEYCKNNKKTGYEYIDEKLFNEKQFPLKQQGIITITTSFPEINLTVTIQNK